MTAGRLGCNLLKSLARTLFQQPDQARHALARLERLDGLVLHAIGRHFHQFDAVAVRVGDPGAAVVVEAFFWLSGFISGKPRASSCLAAVSMLSTVMQR